MFWEMGWSEYGLSRARRYHLPLNWTKQPFQSRPCFLLDCLPIIVCGGNKVLLDMDSRAIILSGWSKHQRTIKTPANYQNTSELSKHQRTIKTRTNWLTSEYGLLVGASVAKVQVFLLDKRSTCFVLPVFRGSTELMRIYKPTRQLRSSSDTFILCIPTVRTHSLGQR